MTGQRRRRYSYDEKCEELARLFLGDEPDLLTDRDARELAQDIQDAIESYIAMRLEERLREKRDGA